MKSKIQNRMILLATIVALFLVSCAQTSPSATAPTPIDIGAVAALIEPETPIVQTSAPADPAVEAPAIAAAPATSLAVAVPDLENELIALYERTNPSVVFIIALAGDFSLGSGSGFLFDDEGHIVTNNHVIADGNRYEVVFSSGERSRATVVGSDADADLAVIKVETVPSGVVPLPLAKFADVKVGQFSVAIGNPFGQQGSMSLGIISGLDRSLPGEIDLTTASSYSLPQVIQTDAPINPGNSGGPLLNLDGEVIGVNTAIRSDTGVNSGVGFSVPVAAVQRIVPELIRTGEYVYPRMGVSIYPDISLDAQEALGLPQLTGAYVTEVSPGTAAALAGLRGADPETGRGGDLIIAMDGQEIRSFSDLNSYLVFNTEPGQIITVTILRDGATLDLPLTLGARP